MKDSPQELADRLQFEADLVILTEHEWNRIAADRPFPAPLVKSKGAGPDGDAPLVLIRGMESAAAEKRGGNT